MRIDAFTDLVRERRSCRAYDPDRPVPRALIRACVEAARLAPSACNRQPWHFVAVDAPETVHALVEHCKLPGIPHLWWADVPVFVALCAELEMVSHRLAPAVSGIPYHFIDLGIAGEHFVLAAQAAGLGTCWIGWFREKAVRQVLHIPRRVRVGALITLGYPRETARSDREKQRKTVTEVLSWNDWRHGESAPAEAGMPASS